MKTLRPTLLAVALGAALPAFAQSNAELMNELKALRDRVNELERQIKEQAAKPAAPPPGQWGMTPEQAAELNRVTVKTEALQDSFEAQGFKGLTISGYMDPSYIWNQRQDSGGFVFLSQQDGYYYDTSYIGMAALSFVKEMEGGTVWKLVLSPSRGVGAAVDGMSIVEQANVSVPLGDLQTRFIAGQFVDWSGYEALEPTVNAFVTHNLLFDFTAPTAYTGAGMELARGDWTTKFLIANINDPSRSQGQIKPAGVIRVDYEKSEFWGAGVFGLYGYTTNFNKCDDGGCDKTLTALFDIDGWYARGELSLAGQISYGQQKQAAIMPSASGSLQDAQWWGVSGEAGWNFTQRLQGLLRASYIYNRKNGGGLLGYTGYWPDQGVDGDYGDYRNGIGPAPGLGCEVDVTASGCDRGANRWAFSIGLRYVFNLHTAFKFEYRYDASDKSMFYDVNSGGYDKYNQLLGASVVVSF